VKQKEQVLYIGGALILLAVLYFGFDIYPSSKKALETSRALTSQAFDLSTSLPDAKKGLEAKDLQYLETLEAQLQHAPDDSSKAAILKQLSGHWFSLKNPMLAGLYAREVADLENSAMGWSITGTTFAAGLQMELEEKQKRFVRDQAIEAFEKAISLEPEVIEHRVNQALCYIELPEPGEPMKGIQMLSGLATKYPDSPVPPFQLARLAVRTGQYDRAKTRIDQALVLAPEDQRIACLGQEIYTALNMPAEAEKLSGTCAGTK
jgi:tetratricopeptide (TPR) repeat protein